MAGKYRYVVLGAGRQGAAIAFDLAKNCDAADVLVTDRDERIAVAAVARLRRLLPQHAGTFRAQPCDVTNIGVAIETMRGAHVVLSAVPYRYNAALTDAAITAGASFNDLGGNTGVVREQLARADAARRAGVSIVPDCGLAPGLGNILAAHGVSKLELPRSAHVRCGGLPQTPIGPLQYKLVFNFDGLINEYSGLGEFLRGGKRVEVPTLEELEPIEFRIDLPGPSGGGAAKRLSLEAAVTSGGTSTCPDSFAGKLIDYDYKTIRYPGHFAIIRAMFKLGCFDSSLQTGDGRRFEPRATMQAVFEKALQFPEIRDMVLLRATVRGVDRGRETTLQYDLVDFHDELTGFTAMERTTAYPTALVAHMQARGLIAAGASPLERCIPTDQYMSELAVHDIRICASRD